VKSLCPADCFAITSVIRQGGVLSQYLFVVYLDEFSVQLGSTGVRYTLGNVVLTQQLFPNDICTFGLSISGLQCLLNIFHDCTVEHKILLNCHRMFGVVFFLKCIYNMQHQMYLWRVYGFSLLNKSNILVFYFMPLWKVTVAFKDKWNDLIVQQTSSEAYLPCAQPQYKILYFIHINANVCLTIMEQFK